MKSAFAIFAALSACAGFAALKPVKFIAHGWDCQSANPAAVLENADLFADTALDGISLSVRFKKADGTTMYLSTENVKKSLLWISPPVPKWFN